MNARISSQAVKRCCFFLAIVLVCSSTPMLWAQTRHEKIVFSIPSRSIAAIDLYVARSEASFAMKDSTWTSCKSAATRRLVQQRGWNTHWGVGAPQDPLKALTVSPKKLVLARSA